MIRTKAIYPGSFDPPTNGHLDLIERGSHLFDELVVAILRNAEKESLFTLGERRKMLQALTARYGNVRVDTFEGLPQRVFHQQPGHRTLPHVAVSRGERRKMLQALTARYGNVRVDTFEGLLVEYALRQRAQAVLRGIRAISDYEYELQM